MCNHLGDDNHDWGHFDGGHQDEGHLVKDHLKWGYLD